MAETGEKARNKPTQKAAGNQVFATDNRSPDFAGVNFAGVMGGIFQGNESMHRTLRRFSSKSIRK
ncbi:MAG: hypothetical protein R2778_18250 [Saprospiraceae bacterium]